LSSIFKYESTDAKKVHNDRSFLGTSVVPLVALESYCFSNPVKDLESLLKYWRETPDEESQFPKDYNWICDQIADKNMECSEEELKEFLEDPYIDEEEKELRRREISLLLEDDSRILQEQEETTIAIPNIMEVRKIESKEEVSKKKRKHK